VRAPSDIALDHVERRSARHLKCQNVPVPIGVNLIDWNCANRGDKRNSATPILLIVTVSNAAVIVA
jgi:hypothetical protein